MKNPHTTIIIKANEKTIRDPTVASNIKTRESTLSFFGVILSVINVGDGSFSLRLGNVLEDVGGGEWQSYFFLAHTISHFEFTLYVSQELPDGSVQGKILSNAPGNVQGF